MFGLVFLTNFLPILTEVIRYSELKAKNAYCFIHIHKFISGLRAPDG